MPAPKVQYLERIEDIDAIAFTDGLAAVMVAAGLLDALPLVSHERSESERLARLRRSIRARGFVPTMPIICRIGMKGRWVVADGGHRITAARQVMDEWWTNLLGSKVRHLYFLLFTTPRSWQKVRAVAEAQGVSLASSPPELPGTADWPGDGSP